MTYNPISSGAHAPAPAQVLNTNDKDYEYHIKQVIRLIKSACTIHPYTIAFSGGKDSVVLSYLAKEAGVNVPHVYNLTTIDPKGTTAFCRSYHCDIKRPEHTFLELVERKGMPTMFRRFCCKELKEKYISDFVMTGVRRSESVKRAKRYCSFEDVYRYNKSISTTRLHPLVFMTDDDIEYIINSRQLQCHPLYYDEQGNFHVERRLGCQGCPLQSDRGKADYAANTKLLYQVAKRILLFHQCHNRSSYDAYENMVYHFFYSNHGFVKFQQTYRGLFKHDPKQFLEDYFKITLP